MHHTPFYHLSCFLTWTIVATAHANSSSQRSAVLPITAIEYGTSHVVEIQLGSQSVNVTIDTGSSNLYVVDSTYECYALSNTSVFGPQVPKAKCGFADTTYKPSSTFQSVASEWMGINYASGNIVGPAGTDMLQLGGITIPHQLFGLANSSSEGLGNPAASGLLGLAWPGASFVHPSDTVAKTNAQLWENRLLYDTTSVNVAKVAGRPYFALAIGRTPLGSDIPAFGEQVGPMTGGCTHTDTCTCRWISLLWNPPSRASWRICNRTGGNHEVARACMAQWNGKKHILGNYCPVHGMGRENQYRSLSSRHRFRDSNSCSSCFDRFENQRRFRSSGHSV